MANFLAFGNIKTHQRLRTKYTGSFDSLWINS